jgi:2'-5' RNA ligase
MTDTIRTFIALELPSNVQQQLGDIQNAFKPLDCAIKWVEPHNIHLTLKFLGSLRQEQIAAVISALEPLIPELRAGDYPVTAVSAFPHEKKPRVFIASLGDEQKRIPEIAARIETALAGAGFPKEQRAFKSHITLGRFKSAKNMPAFLERKQAYQLPDGIRIPFGNITVYKSTLTPAGPVYEVLRQFRLQ